MATPAIATPIPDNVKAARLQVQTTDFFALCYLMLSNLAYTDGNNAQQAVQQIINMLPTMPVPNGGVAGEWILGWGPVASSDNSNLMYAAEFVDKASGLPIFSAVSIRGTDTQASPAGVLKQIVEDLDADHQVVFPDGNTVGSKIANGTKIGLDTLTAFRDKTGKTVAQYLNDVVNTNARTPIVITGHSLGGCQTTVVAMHLASQLPSGTSIVPNTFAAPTAGNAAFIQLYEKTFSFCPRWHNTLDLVPHAFADLTGIKQLWTGCQRPAPDAFKIVIDGYSLLLKILHINYSQQSDNDSRALVGVCQPPNLAAVSPTAHAQAVAEIQNILQDAAAKIQNDIKQLPVIGGLSAHTLSLNISAASLQGIDQWVQELLFQHSILTGYWDAVKGSQGVAPINNPFAAAPPAAASAAAPAA